MRDGVPTCACSRFFARGLGPGLPFLIPYRRHVLGVGYLGYLCMLAVLRLHTKE
jgi:hypothetical protein